MAMYTNATKRMCGDNKNSVHYMRNETVLSDVTVAFCIHCHKKFALKNKDPRYKKSFKRDTLQAHENLYYKVYPNRMKVVQTVLQ